MWVITPGPTPQSPPHRIPGYLLHEADPCLALRRSPAPQRSVESKDERRNKPRGQAHKETYGRPPPSFIPAPGRGVLRDIVVYAYAWLDRAHKCEGNEEAFIMFLTVLGRESCI